jgi:multidrug efflux pump subunit AcrA (membrane-fusion protein)
MKPKYYYILPPVIILAGIGGMVFFSSLGNEAPRKAPLVLTKSVEARVVRPATLRSTITGLGRVTSTQPVQLASEVSGVVMSGDVPFLPAQRFRKGDVLLRIDDRQVRLGLNSTKSDFLTALASVLPEIKVDFPERYPAWQRYFDSVDFTSRVEELPEVTDQKIKLYLSRFNVYKLFFAVRDLEITLEKHQIRAPFSGSVISTAVRPGSTARVGSAIGEIISMEDLEVEIPLPTEDIAWIREDAPVSLRSRDDGRTWTGRILRKGSVIDKRTQTVPVFVSVNGGNGLYEGMYLAATIPGRDIPGAVTVPRRALYNDAFVYVVDGGRLERRDVRVVRIEHDSVLVAGGLGNRDTLVTEMLQGIAPGIPATPRVRGIRSGGK